MALRQVEISRQFAAARAAASPEALRRIMIAGARREIAAIEAGHVRQLGINLPRRVIVDGAAGGIIDQAKGVIVVEWFTTTLAARWIIEELRRRSPVLTGRYRDQHRIMVDGHEVADVRGLRPQAEIAFVNLLPYARKIERGFSRQAPDGLYEITARLAKRRFPALDVVYGYREFAGFEAGRPRRKTRSSKAASRRFPTIILSARS